VTRDVFVSTVIPLDNDADIVAAAVRDVSQVLRKSYTNYELILVDDGSSDDTKQVLNDLVSDEECLRVFVFARRFGLEIAIACGLDNAIGDVVVVLRPECDPPALIPEFVDQAQSCRGIVVGTRDDFPSRSYFYKLAYNLYYRLCSVLLERPQIYGSTHYIALTRMALNSVLRIKNSYRFLRVISMYAGHQVIPRRYEQIHRRTPDRHRDLPTLVEDCSSMIFSNSLRPLRQAGAVAGLAGLCNFAFAGYFALAWLFARQDQPSAASSFGGAFMFGIVLVVLAAICEYLACVLEEVKFHPLYFLEEELQSSIMTRDKLRNLVYSESADGPLPTSPPNLRANA
jgi:polyisoprenyl-phosphate glycosyltransferase